MTRQSSAIAFLAAILAFGLPFGMVSSCSGEQVHFTGVQLATFKVPPDRKHPGGTLNRDVEHNASLLAIAVVVTALIGIGIAMSGRQGGGICASLALIFTQLLGWAILATGSGGGGDLLSGFWVALASLVAAAILHLVLLLQVRRQLGRSMRWPAIGRIALVTVLPIVVVFLVAFAGSG